jgi:hypothetical protein
MAFNLFIHSTPQMGVNNLCDMFSRLEGPLNAAMEGVITTLESIEAWRGLERAL